MPAKKGLRLIDAEPGGTAPPPPGHLGPAGRDLWCSIQASYAIDDPGGCALLQQAAEAVDRVAECREAIAEDGAVVKSRGSVRAHPLLASERDARAALLRAIRYFNLDVEPLKNVGRPPGR